MKYKDIVQGPKNASRIILGCMRMPALSVDAAAKMIERAGKRAPKTPHGNCQRR